MFRHHASAAMTTSITPGVYLGSATERIIFGAPAAQAVIAEADRYGARRIFVTTTRSLATNEKGPVPAIVAALGSRHVGTFAAISAHSPREDVISGAAAARAAKADLIVAVGGGSVIDATKVMLLALWFGIDRPDGLDCYRTGLGAKGGPASLDPPAGAIRMLSVSTTLSAPEFTSMAGVTDMRTKAKEGYAHRLFAPRSIILDPAATLATPPWLLFSTGIRAVDHAVEGYCNPAAHPATEAASLQGLTLLARALPAIKHAPTDLAARHEAQMGVWQAILPLSSGITTGASHGIGYALGASFDVPHGHTSCVMLPAVLAWNAVVNADRQRALSAAMGAADRPAADLVRALIAGLDQPTTLRGVGIRRENLPEIAERALTFPPVRANPRAITTPAEVLQILELAW
jgi:maleylacetate reductase